MIKSLIGNFSVNKQSKTSHILNKNITSSGKILNNDTFTKSSSISFKAIPFEADWKRLEIPPLNFNFEKDRKKQTQLIQKILPLIMEGNTIANTQKQESLLKEHGADYVQAFSETVNRMYAGYDMDNVAPYCCHVQSFVEHLSNYFDKEFSKKSLSESEPEYKSRILAFRDGMLTIPPSFINERVNTESLFEEVSSMPDKKTITRYESCDDIDEDMDYDLDDDSPKMQYFAPPNENIDRLINVLETTPNLHKSTIENIRDMSYDLLANQAISQKDEKPFIDNIQEQSLTNRIVKLKNSEGERIEANSAKFYTELIHSTNIENEIKSIVKFNSEFGALESLVSVACNPKTNDNCLRQVHNGIVDMLQDIQQTHSLRNYSKDETVDILKESHSITNEAIRKLNKQQESEAILTRIEYLDELGAHLEKFIWLFPEKPATEEKLFMQKPPAKPASHGLLNQWKNKTSKDQISLEPQQSPSKPDETIQKSKPKKKAAQTNNKLKPETNDPPENTKNDKNT